MTDIKLSEIPKSDELRHFGVQGMRWGVRKPRPSRSDSIKIKTKTPPPPDNRSDDSKRAQSLRSKKVSELSNDELRTLNQRVELERKFKDLNPNKVQKGIQTLTMIVNTASTVQKAYKLVNNPLGTKGGNGKGDKDNGGISSTLAKAKAAAMARSGKKTKDLSLDEIRTMTTTNNLDDFFKGTKKR